MELPLPSKALRMALPSSEGASCVVDDEASFLEAGACVFFVFGVFFFKEQKEEEKNQTRSKKKTKKKR